jgi:hypothetical protein
MIKIGEIIDDKKGSRVDLVKTKIRMGQTSAAPVGAKIKGVLAKDIQLGKPIYIVTEGDDYRHASSEVISIAFRGKKMIIGTETSIYEMERL